MRRYLLLAYFDQVGLETIKESVNCWSFCEKHRVDVLNLKDSVGSLAIPPEVSLSTYDGLIVHNTVSYNPENLYQLDRLQSLRLQNFKGRKILLKQDEHLKSALTDQAIVDLEFDVVFTLTKPSYRRRFYPKALDAGTEFSEWLTGYVPDRLKDMKVSPIGARPLDLIYRGSLQPESFGKLAYEKAAIATRAQHALAGRGLKLDISNRWEDRKFGESWYQFLGSAKATLGVESGASVLDPHGRLQRVGKRVASIFPQERFSSLRRTMYFPWEESGIYSALAPRHFEAIATKTVQFMYPGEFSGILDPNTHYVSISRENTDWDLVAETLGDWSRLEAIATVTYRDVIESGRYSYQSFIRSAEAHL